MSQIVINSNLFKISFFFISLSFGFNVFAAKLVFFKSYNPSGQPLIFEGLYAHGAISYKGQWLHAHPRYGVQLTPDLKHFGASYIILENPNYPEPSDDFVNEQLQMKFNIFADWFNLEETYCSKLVGQALNMRPTKMHFQSKDWNVTRAANHRGKLGLSPSDIYWHARRNLGFKKAASQNLNLTETKIGLKNCGRFL